MLPDRVRADGVLGRAAPSQHGSRGMTKYVEVPCPRCNGTDFVPQFAHVDHGHCFRCGGKGTIRQRLAPDGTVDHDHRIAGFAFLSEADPPCVLCGLPASEWPPVVPAQWWGDQWEVFLPGQTKYATERVFVEGERRKAQREARALILARVPKARIKWIDRTKANAA